jgi:UMF1 family MFS transporter
MTVVADAEDQLSDRRERVGWYFYDWANSAFYTSVITVFLGPYLTAIAKHAVGCASDDPCKDRTVDVLGLHIPPGSLYPYAVSLSVFLTVFALPVAGAIADRTVRKKELLAAFAYIGCAATIGLLFLTGDRYILGVVLFIVANIAFGASVVVYYSFLPYLATPDQRDSVSSLGWGIGYLGGGLLLLLNVVAVLFKDRLGLDTGQVARYSMVSSGLWWAGFTTIPLIRLRNRPLPPGTEQRRGNPVSDGFKQLWATLKSLRAVPLTLFFLVAYLTYNDAIQAVISLSSTYGTEELHLEQSVLVPTILLVQFLAFFGSLLLGWLAKQIGGWKTVLCSLVLWMFVLLGAWVVPARQPVLFVLLGCAIGIVLGGSQALSRSLFSHLIPKGREGEYFGLYEISDKGTSWLAPLVFGIAYELTRSYRIAIGSLLIFFVIGFGLLLAVPIRRAIVAAGNVPPVKL